MQKTWAVSILMGLAACGAPTDVPQLNSGVGFGSYSDYQKQRAEQEAARRRQEQIVPGPKISEESTAPTPVAVATPEPAPDPVEEPEAVAAVTPEVDEAPSGPLSTVSDENNFEMVTAERSIEEDELLLERNRELYVVIEPTDLPKRPGTNTPNIVAYALTTTNSVGQPLYQRTLPNRKASERACARYVSDDLAQEAFLLSGGPKRDPKRLDPDGDGFACSWDPSVFRVVRN